MINSVSIVNYTHKKQQASPQLTQAVLDAVDNQLRDLKPPETKETCDRLIASGIHDKEVQRLRAVTFSSERKIYRLPAEVTATSLGLEKDAGVIHRHPAKRG